MFFKFFFDKERAIGYFCLFNIDLNILSGDELVRWFLFFFELERWFVLADRR